MKKIILKFAVAGSAVITCVGSFAFAPKHFGNQIFAQRTGTTFSYSTSKPSGPGIGCKADATQTSCTITSTATVGFFTANFTNTFPAPSTVSGTPAVTYLDGGKIYK